MKRRLALPLVGALALFAAAVFLVLGSAQGPEVPQETRTATFSLG